MIALGVVVALLLLGPLVARFGADTRDGRDWQPAVPRAAGRPLRGGE